MTKTQVRMLKIHYGIRWTAFRHNRKNQNKILPIEEKFVLSNVLPGKVVAYNCLGELYKDLLDVSIDLELCNTFLLINSPDFKYKTLQQIFEIITSFDQYLTPNGRYIVNIDLTKIIYPRLYVSLPSLCNSIKQIFCNAGYSVEYNLVPMNKTNYGYGQLYMLIDRHV